MADFSHLNQNGEAAMVDVSGKGATVRMATVSGVVEVSATCAATLNEESLQAIKTTARIAGIQAAKKTADLIPMCHPLALKKADVSITFAGTEFRISAMAKTEGVTGVEMEAFTAAQIAALTIYDMIKAVDPSATLGGFKLTEKQGGKSGLWRRHD